MSTGTAPSASTPTVREPTVISSENVSASAKSWVGARLGPEAPGPGQEAGALTRTSSGLSVGVPAGSASV